MVEIIFLGLQRNYSEDGAEDEMMKESPLPAQRHKPPRPPRKGSISGSRSGMNNAGSEGELNGYGDMNGDVSDDKKKRGRSPFR